MKNIIAIIEIARLIIKEKCMGLSFSDKKILENWLLNSENNRKSYKDVSKRDYSKIKSEYDVIDTEKQWSLFNDNINKRKSQSKNSRKLTFIISSAAVIVLFLGITLLLNISSSKNERATYKQYKPKTVQLILGNGENVDLQNINRDSVIDNISIHNGSRQLVYKYDSLTTIVQNNTIIVPRASFYHVILSDGTNIWLNSESTLVYPTVFVGDTRTVSLTGEAYFKVKHNVDIPFIVHTKGVDIKVLGTVFDVNTNAHNNDIQTVLIEGSISLNSTKTKDLILKPGQLAVFNVQKENLKIYETNLKEYVSWMDRMFCFRNTSMRDVLKKIQLNYDIDIVTSENLEGEYFTGDISMDKPIVDVLKSIELSVPYKFIYENKKLYVQKDMTKFYKK